MFSLFVLISGCARFSLLSMSVWAYRSLGIHWTERLCGSSGTPEVGQVIWDFSLDRYLFWFLGLFFRCSWFLFWVSAVDIQGYTCSRGKVLLYGFPEKVVLSLYLGDRSKPYILLYSQMLCWCCVGKPHKRVCCTHLLKCLNANFYRVDVLSFCSVDILIFVVLMF